MRAAESAPWAESVPSVLSDHGTECCATARAWYMAMDRSMWRGEGGPAWIPRKFPWGPTRWPFFWCEAMAAKELDCGAHQALSMEAFRARGIRVEPVQLVLRQEVHHLPHCHGRWDDASASPAWAREGVAYHEACATVRDGRTEVWDATLGAWLSPRHLEGVRSIAAVRIGGTAASGETVDWKGVRLPLGEWVGLEAGGGGG